MLSRFEETPAQASFSLRSQNSENAGRCAVFGCADQSRLRLDGKGACGRPHLSLLLRARAAEEQISAARARLAVLPVLPVGTILARAGSITEPQLAAALRTQETTGSGKLGAWLRQQTGLCEEALGAALAAQQRLPSLALDRFDPAGAAPALPRPLVERFGAVPFSAADKSVVFAFEDRADPGLLGAVRRMHGRDASAGVLPATAFWQAMRASLAVRLPAAVECEAASPDQLTELLSHVLVRAGACAASLVAVRDTFWLRFTREGSSAPRDVVCTLAEPETRREADADIRLAAEALAARLS